MRLLDPRQGGFYVALLRPAGTVVWSHRYDRGQGARLVIDGKGRVTASGTAVSPSGYPVVAVYAYATNGVLRWRSQSGGATGSGKLVTDMVRYGSSNVWVSGLSTIRTTTGASCILDGGCDSRADSRRLVV